MRFQAPESLSEQIAQHLGQQIIKRECKPGERIQELRISGDLNVSRGSVREALLILERRHLVEIFPRRGAVVSSLTADRVNGLYDLYIDLLCMLARKVFECRAGSDLNGVMAKVGELQAAMAVATRGGAAAEQVINAGFELVCYACELVQNPFLAETLENLRPAISRTFFMALESSREDTGAAGAILEQLSEAASQHNVDTLQAAMQAFGEQQRRQVLSILTEEESA